MKNKNETNEDKVLDNGSNNVENSVDKKKESKKENKKDNKNRKELEENTYPSAEVDFKKVNTKKMSLQQLEVIKQEIEKSHIDFLKIVDEVDIAADNYRVLLILGENELVYDSGEFFIGETLKTEVRKKIARKQAQQIFVDYYVRHHINADIKDQIKKADHIKEISKSKKEIAHQDRLEKKEEAKGIAADILKKHQEEELQNKKLNRKSIEEEIELM
ncbi:MAG: hypothetical protein RSC09_01470 [Clostridia bacterium]